MEFVVPLIVFLILGPALIVIASRTIEPEERPWLTRVMMIAFLLRALVASFFELFQAARLFHDDASRYEAIGVLLALSWRGEYPPIQLGAQNNGYHYICGGICYVFGTFPLNIAMVNAVLGALTAWLIYRLARQFFHISVVRFATLLAAFTPSIVLWGGMALKDPVMIFLIVATISAAISLKKKITLTPLLVIAVSVVAMQAIRFYMIYFVALAVLGAVAFDRSARLLTGISKQVVVVLAVGAFVAVLGLEGPALQGAETFDLQRVSDFRRGMATSAQSGFSQDVDISTPGKAIAFLPVGMATLLLAPFPWQVVSLRPLIALPETMVWWFLFPSTVRGLMFVFKRRFAILSPLFIFVFSLTCGYSLTHGNVGSAFRQRAQIFILLFLFTAVGYYQKKCRQLGLDEERLLRPE
jgi:hypothetical protein